DQEVSPYPFIALSRLPGRTWSGLEASATLDQVIKVLEGLGQAIASWHRLDPRTLPRRVRARSSRRADTFAHQLDLDVLRADAIEAARRLGLSYQHVSTWLGELEPLVALAPVLVHGDVNEGQILVDDALHVTGILDWETAGVGHPLKDFDLGEWGYGIFAWERDFDTLRRAMWEAYARARGGALPSWRAVHLYYCITWAAQLGRAKELTPWRRAHLENNLELLRRIADCRF